MNRPVTNNRDKARSALYAAESQNNADFDPAKANYATISALLGIGYALLELADAERDRTMEIVGGLKGNRVMHRE